MVVQVVSKQESLGERRTVEGLLLLSAGLAWTVPALLNSLLSVTALEKGSACIPDMILL